jgi:hypothetical protein
VADFVPLLPAQLSHAVREHICVDVGEAMIKSALYPVRWRLPLFKFPCSSCSWIRPVGRWLSHEWIDATRVTTKAAKRDDATIATDMWNKRLLFLYPKCCPNHLASLQTWMLCWVR